MTKRLVWIVLLQTAVLAGLWSQSENPDAPAVLTIDEAVEYAWGHTTAIKNAGINIADAEQQIIERRATGLPSLSGSASYNRYLEIPVQVLPEQFVQLIQALNPGEEVSPEASFLLKNNFTAGLSLDAMIFDGSYFTALKAAKVYRQYVQEEMLVEKREVRNQVTDAYLPVLLVDENLEILDRNIENLEKLLFETRELYEAGFAEQLDIDRLELSLSNLEIERENLEQQRTSAMNVLKFVLNFPMDRELVLTEDLENYAETVSGDALSGPVNLDRRPEIGLANAGIELQDLNVEVNKQAFLPTLRGTVVYQQQYQGDNFSDGFWAPTSFVGLNLNVPIFDGFGKKATVERARLEREKVINQRQDLQRSIRMEVHNARIEYLNARRSLDGQSKNLDLARRIYETTQIKYREGVGSSLEVNQAEQSLYQTQSNYLQSLYNLVTARFALNRALGN
jgi:outer membrane protein